MSTFNLKIIVKIPLVFLLFSSLTINHSHAIDINWTINSNTTISSTTWNNNASNQSSACQSSNYRSSTDCLQTRFDNYNITGSNTLTLNITSNLSYNNYSSLLQPSITDSSANVISGTGGLTKTGSATLDLMDSQLTYTGRTRINAGTLRASSANTLSDTTRVSVSSGATYDVDGSDTVGSIEGAGTIDIASGVTLTAGNGTNRTFSGILSGAGTLNKTGSSTLTISGTSNSITGTLRVSQGNVNITGRLGNLNEIRIENSSSTVTLNSHDNFGGHMASSPSIVFTAGGTLSNAANRFNHIGPITLVDGATLTTNGNHSSGGTPIAGMNLDGDITLGNNATANFNATNSGTYGLGSGSDTPANRNFTIGSNSTLNINAPLVNGQGGASGWPTNKPSANITKSGTGTLVLAGANTYTGNTTISAGTLEITGTLGTSASYAGTISNSGTLTFNSSSNQTLTGSVTGSGIWNKSGSGRLTITGSNPFNGTININAGTFRIASTAGTSSQTVNVLSGATLDLDDKNFQSNTRVITIEGTGVGNVGALYLSDGGSDNTAFNNSTIQLNADASIGAASGDTLRLYDGDANTVITSQGSENNSLTITGLGKVQVEDDINLGSGNITVGSNATLEMQGNSGNTIVGISAGTVTVNGTMILDSHDVFGNHIASSRPTMVINGTLTNATGHINMLGATTLSGATINMSQGHSAGGRTLGIVFDDNVTVSGSSASTVSSSGTAVIGLTSNNASGSRDVTFDVGNVASGTDLTISAAIENGVGSTYPNAVASGLIKDGAGTMSLSSSSNTFTGSTVVRAGTLIVTSLSSSSTVTLTDSSTTSSDTPQLLIPLTTTLASDIVVANNSTASNPVIGSSGSGFNNAFFSGDITLNRNVTFHDAGTDRTTFTGEISSSNNDITITGTRVTLDNDSNSISGATFDVTDGSILQLNNEEVIGSSSTLNTVDLNSTGKLYINGGTGSSFYVGGLTGSGGTVQRNTGGTETINIGNNNDNSFGGVISGSDRNGSAATINVVKVGSGIQTLSGTNTYTGNTTVSAGTLEISGTLGSGDYAGDISNSGTLSFSSSSDQDLTGDISGTGALTKSGTGELKLLGSNTYTGTTTINAGTLRLAGTSSNTATLGQTNVTVNSEGRFIIDNYSSINGNATIDINSGGEMRVKRDLSNNITISGGGNTSSVTNKGAIINTSGNNTYSGLITLDGNATIAANSNNMTFNVSSGNSFTGTGDLTFDTSSNTITVSDPIAVTGNVIKEDSGTLVLAGTNSYSGSTTISGGTLNLTGSLPNTTALTVATGALFDTSNHETVGSIAGAGTIDIGHKTQLTVGGDNTSTTFSGVIRSDSGSGTGGITKQGTGTLTLSGTNTFSGPVNISAGTVAVTANDALGDTGNITNISSGATLDLQNVNYSTTETVRSSGTISTSTGTSTLAGSVALDGNSIVDVDGTQLTLSGAVSGSNNLEKTGDGIVILSGTNTYTGNTTISAGTLRITGTLNSSTNVSVSSGATFDVDASNTIGSISGSGIIDITNSTTLTSASGSNTTFGGVIQGSGSLTKSGSGALTLSGTNTYSGNTRISGGSVILTGALSNSTSLTVASSSSLDLRTTQTIAGLNLDGTISNGTGSSSLIVSGTSDIGGNITTTGTQTYRGATTLSAANTLTTTNSSITFGNTVNSNSSARDLTLSVGSGSVQFSGIVGATNALANIDITGALDLDASISGATTLAVSGTSNIGANVTTTGTQSYSGTTTLSGGDRTLQGSTVTLAAVTGGSNALTVTGNLDLDGAISGVTDLSVSGTSNIGANVTTTGTQSYSGTTTISASSTLNGTGITAAAIVLDDNLKLTNSNSSSVSGVISGTGNLRKLGSGALTLSGTNTYSGSTTISNGRLTVSGTLNDNTIVSVASGAVYDVDETDEIGSVFGAGNIEIASSKTLTTGDADGSSTTRTISGIISGAGGFTKKGEGRLNLTGDSTYTGTTSITNGQLRLQSGSSIDSTTINVSGDGRLYLESEDALVSTTNITLNGAASRLYVAEDNTVNTVSGAGAIHIQSDNILTVTDISSHTGKVKGQGDIVIAASHTLGAFIDTTDSSNDNINTRISGASTTVTMAASNFLPDDEDLTVENSGTLNLNSNTDTVANVNLTSGTISGGTINASNQHTVSSGTIASTATLGGAGALSKTSSGTTTFAGTGSYSGATTVSAGTLTVTGALSNTTGVTLSGGTMNLNSTSAVNSSADMTVSSGSLNVNENTTVADFTSSSGTTTTIANGRMLTVNPGTANNDIYGLAGSGGFKKMGSVRSILRGSHSYTGETRVTEGILQLASGGSINSSTDLIIESGAEFDLDESITAASLADAGNVDVASSKVLTINGSGTKTFTGRLRGSGGFTYSGSGVMTFRGNNDISGPIAFNSGTIYAGTAADTATTIFSNNITLAGATLGGGGRLGGNVTSTGGSLAPGNSIGTLTIDGNLELDSSSTTTIEFDTTSADKVIVSGNITLDGSLILEPDTGTYVDKTFTIFDGSGGSGNTLTGTFASTTVNNSSNLGAATTSISYDTVNRKVFLAIDDNVADSEESDSSETVTIVSKTTHSKFKDIADIFDKATSGKILEVANVLKSSDANSVNTELDKLEGTVFATTYSQPALNHGHFNRALNNVTAANINTSLVSSFTNNTDQLTLASLQEAGLYKDKKNYNEYYDYSDTSVLGFIKNNKNKSLLSDFQSDDRTTFIRTYGTTADRKNIGSSYTGYQSDTAGILFGQQFKNDEETFSGYSYGFTGTDTDYKNNYGESKTYSMHASLFRQYDKDDYGLNLISGMYVSKTESERNVSVFTTSLNDKYISDYWDIGLNQEAQFIKKISFGGLNIAPSAKLNSTYVFKSNTKETGGELALTIDNENIFIVKPEIGLSIGTDLSEKDNINNEFNIAMFASQDHFIEGTSSKARFTSGSSFNVDLPRDQETYYSLGFGYNFLNKDTDTSLMANAFVMQNEHNDMDSNIFSFTFRKLFGEFGKGKIPPVIAKKPKQEEDVSEIFLPDETTSETVIKEGEKSLEQLEENIEIVLKENPTEEEVGEVYRSLSDSLIAKRKLTVNDVYNNLAANCYAVENNLVQLVNYYNKLQLYKILDKCNKLSEPKVHLIAERLHQIQLDETTKLQELYYGYLRILNYVPYITFIAFIILAYEFVRSYIVAHFRSRRSA